MRAAVLVMSLLSMSCATTTTSAAPALTAIQLDEGYKNAARMRAAFELPCTTALDTMFVGEPASAGVMTTDRKVAVGGCGKKTELIARCTMTTVDSITIVAQKCIALSQTTTPAKP